MVKQIAKNFNYGNAQCQTNFYYNTDTYIATFRVSNADSVNILQGTVNLRTLEVYKIDRGFYKNITEKVVEYVKVQAKEIFMDLEIDRIYKYIGGKSYV